MFLALGFLHAPSFALTAYPLGLLDDPNTVVPQVGLGRLVGLLNLPSKIMRHLRQLEARPLKFNPQVSSKHNVS